MAFTTEALQALGLNDEQVKGVMAEHGKDVNELKEHNSTLTAERDSYKSQVDEVTKNLEAAKKNAEKGSEAQQQVEELQQQLKDSEKQAQEQLKSQQKAFSIDKALSDAGAKNNKAVEALLDVDAINIDENGTLNGLSEQLEKLQADTSTGFLFNTGDDENNKNPSVKIIQQGNPGRGSNTTIDLSKMPYKEQLELKQSNPEQYEAARNELQGGIN
ncbi:scaffolding protein [Weissella viridescens]|uniref:Scaffolding protein n=1 Tax=Weissella viridescens TaxID=1629 RepID=A0A3P2RBY9_WEIVI|nr:phage scaffolding protein [Weissella viridescens]RRG18259.1 scaffolding protein [Weissella viridescens]